MAGRDFLLFLLIRLHDRQDVFLLGRLRRTDQGLVSRGAMNTPHPVLIQEALKLVVVDAADKYAMVVDWLCNIAACGGSGVDLNKVDKRSRMIVGVDLRREGRGIVVEIGDGRRGLVFKDVRNGSYMGVDTSLRIGRRDRGVAAVVGNENGERQLLDDAGGRGGVDVGDLLSGIGGLNVLGNPIRDIEGEGGVVVVCLIVFLGMVNVDTAIVRRGLLTFRSDEIRTNAQSAMFIASAMVARESRYL